MRKMHDELRAFPFGADAVHLTLKGLYDLV